MGGDEGEWNATRAAVMGAAAALDGNRISRTTTTTIAAATSVTQATLTFIIRSRLSDRRLDQRQTAHTRPCLHYQS